MQHKFNIFADIFFTKKKTEETERKKEKKKNTQWGFLELPETHNRSEEEDKTKKLTLKS